MTTRSTQPAPAPPTIRAHHTPLADPVVRAIWTPLTLAQRSTLLQRASGRIGDVTLGMIAEVRRAFPAGVEDEPTTERTMGSRS